MKLEELADSLDEIWLMLSDVEAKLDEVNNRLDNRDKHNLLMIQHVERLVKDVEFYQRYIGVRTVSEK